MENKSEYNVAVNNLQDELLRKDKIIADLKEQNALLMRTMFREKEKTAIVNEQAQRLLEINKTLKDKLKVTEE